MHNRCRSFTSFATFDSSTYWIRLDCNKKTTLESYADMCQQGWHTLRTKLDSSKTKYSLNDTITSEIRLLYLKMNIAVGDASTDILYFFRIQSWKQHYTYSLCSFQAWTCYRTKCGKEGRKVLPADKVQYCFILFLFNFSKKIKQCLKIEFF